MTSTSDSERGCQCVLMVKVLSICAEDCYQLKMDRTRSPNNVAGRPDRRRKVGDVICATGMSPPRRRAVGRRINVVSSNGRAAVLPNLFLQATHTYQNRPLSVEGSVSSTTEPRDQIIASEQRKHASNQALFSSIRAPSVVIRVLGGLTFATNDCWRDGGSGSYPAPARPSSNFRSLAKLASASSDDVGVFFNTRMDLIDSEKSPSCEPKKLWVTMSEHHVVRCLSF